MRSFAIWCAMLTLTGCASRYVVPANQPMATMSFEVSSSSTGTTFQGYIIRAYNDLTCAPSNYGEILDNKAFAGANAKLGPVQVVAGSPLAFSIMYNEARIAQNRDCSFTSSFVPLPNKNYSVRFAVVDQSLSCGIQISDSSGADVEFQSPERSCAASLAGRVKNGGAGITNWNVQVQRQ